jgi:hypothetical protein
MTPEDIAQCEDEKKLTALASASLARMAQRGLLTRAVLETAANALPPEIIPDFGPPKLQKLPPPIDPEPIVLEPPEESKHVPL